MRICDKCQKYIGESGYSTGEYDFCNKCYKDYQKFRDSLEEKIDKELEKWIKKG